MSKPMMPSFFGAVGAVASLEWLRLRRGHRSTLSVVAAGLVTTVIVIAMFVGASPRGAFETSFPMAFLRFVDLLLAFLCCAQSVAEEVESRTIGYVLVRPASRGAVVLGKLGASSAMVLAVLTVCFAAMAVASVIATGSGASMLPLLGRAYAAVVLHVLCVCTISFTCGALAPEASGVLAILYLGVAEFALSFMPWGFSVFSAAQHAAVVSGVPMGEDVIVTEPAVAALALVVLTVSALVLAMFVVDRREYRYASS